MKKCKHAILGIGGGGGGGGGGGELQERNSYLLVYTRQKIWISYTQEICRIGQDFPLCLHKIFFALSSARYV